MRIRIGKDIKIKWAVLTDGSALPLVKEELTLDMTAPNGRTQSMEFEVEGNVLTATFYGKDQNYTGDYMLTLWKNKGKEGQSVVDKTSAFSLVRYTPQEDPAQKHDNLSATLADLGDTSLVTIDGASETTLVCNLTGYKAVEDVGDLPMEPSTIGYLVGDNLYVYVGEGGDVCLGAYKNCGPFRGLKGDTGAQGPQGNSGYQGAIGELQVVNNLTEGGEAAALSAEMGKVLEEKKQDNLQTYHETGDYKGASVGVENVFHAEASCGDKDTRSALLIVDRDETDVPEERTARLYTENDTTGNGNYIQAGKGAVLLKSSRPGTASEVQVSPEKISMSSPSVEIEDVVGTIKELVDYMATDKTDDEQISNTLNQHKAKFEELTNSVQMLQNDTEDLPSIRDAIDSLGTDKADKSALEMTNKEVAKKQNKLANYIENYSNGSVEIFAQDSVSMRNDSQGGVSTIEVYNEGNTEGVIPVARMSSEKENGDYAYIEARGNEVNIVGDYVTVNGADLSQTIQDVATLKGTGEGSVSKKVTDEIAKVVAKAPSDFDTLKEIADYIATDETNAAEINNTLAALKTRVYELGDFTKTGDAERKAAEETISKNPDISIIHYTVNHSSSHIILQDVNANLTQQVLYYGGHTYIRHIGPNLNANWKKTNPTNIKYNQDSHRIALMHMVNQYGEGHNNIDWVELPTATDSKDGLMTKEQVKSLEGKQDQLANYEEVPSGKTTIKYPDGKARVEVSNVRAAMWANDNKVVISADANGTRMLYTKTAEDGYIGHRDEISIGRHEGSSSDACITLLSRSTTEEESETIKTTSTIQVNPEGISMSSPNGEIGDVVKEISDKADKSSVEELQKTELKLSVLDNGNIVLSNQEGASAEFMPATPSGDPMHYAYVSAGAEYNATTDYILKDAPWKDMVDTVEDKAKWGLDVVDASKVKQMTIKGVVYNYATENRTSPEGGTYLRYFLVGKGSNNRWVEDETKVLHLPGCWYLNGLGDITNDEMLRCYEESPKNVGNYVTQQFGKWSKARTLNARISAYSLVDVSYLFVSNENIEVPNTNWAVYNISNMFLGANRIRYVLNIRYPSNPSIGVGYCNTAARIDGAFSGATSLRGCFLSGLVQSVSFNRCGNISKPSILYTINRAAPTSAISITLHADAYARLAEDADIVAALEAKPLVTLVSA